MKAKTTLSLKRQNVIIRLPEENTPTLKDRRHCVLGYVVALANECGGRLVLGMADH